MVRKVVVAIFTVGTILLSMACAKANITTDSKPTPTLNLKAQVVTFLKALDKVDKQSDAWGKDFSTFMQYSPGMTPMARQTKYQDLLTSFNAIKASVMAVERPSVDKARALHDSYVTQVSKSSQLLTLLQPSVQGIQADNVTVVRIQGLMDELTLADTQGQEARQDLIRQFGLTAFDLAQ
ncbi:MAG: hypothetical protein HY662_02875 [Chloroflexi bacterium]|nr:hypothetical protein [Chloroflexota bacterium]